MWLSCRTYVVHSLRVSGLLESFQLHCTETGEKTPPHATPPCASEGASWPQQAALGRDWSCLHPVDRPCWSTDSEQPFLSHTAEGGAERGASTALERCMERSQGERSTGRKKLAQEAVQQRSLHSLRAQGHWLNLAYTSTGLHAPSAVHTLLGSTTPLSSTNSLHK